MDEVVFDDVQSGHSMPETVDVGDLPDLGGWLRIADHEIPFLLVQVDRVGGDIDFYRALARPRREHESVQGASYYIRKVPEGDWAQKLPVAALGTDAVLDALVRQQVDRLVLDLDEAAGQTVAPGQHEGLVLPEPASGAAELPVDRVAGIDTPMTARRTGAGAPGRSAPASPDRPVDSTRPISGESKGRSMGLVTTIASGLRARLIARAGGIDLTRLDRVPDHLAWPLQRNGVDPVPRLGEMRDRDPVTKLTSFLGLEVWLVTGDAEAREVLADATSYSTDIRPYMGTSGSATDGDIGGLGFTDPPQHTRLRRLLTPEFTMRRLARLQPAIDAVVERQLDELEAALEIDGSVDLAQVFAFPIPFLVICELLGLPDDRREHFRTLASARFDVSSGGMGTIGAISGSRTFLLAEAARQRTDPGPGLIGQIIREHGDEINDFDLGGLADGVFTGGLETSASMLALGSAVLLQERDLWKQIANEPESVPAVVEELLRYLSVVQVAFPRFAKTDVVIAGRPIRKGAVVLVSPPAANRDPRTYAGDDLDPSRATGSHLAFGHGMHRCVGAELARMELRAAFPALARRFPEMQLAVPMEELHFHGMSIVYGVEAVPATLR